MANLGTYDRARVARLFDGGSALPPLSALLGKEARHIFDVFESNYTLTGEERAAHWDEERVTSPYWDPVLASNREASVNMAVDFYRSYMISFTREPREKASVFFVTKNCRLRKIVDARLANRRFATLASTSAATAEGFTSPRLWCDVKDFSATWPFLAGLDAASRWSQYRLRFSWSTWEVLILMERSHSLESGSFRTCRGVQLGRCVSRRQCTKRQ